MPVICCILLGLMMVLALRAGWSRPSGVSTVNRPLYLDSPEWVHREVQPLEKSSKKLARAAPAAKSTKKSAGRAPILAISCAQALQVLAGPS